METLPSPIPDALVELIAQRFRMLSEPVRLRLLDALRSGPATVGQLQASTGASQQNVSKHLQMLLEAGMVRRSKEGPRSYYSIADDSLFNLCEQVCGGIRRHVAELDALLKLEGAPT